MDFQTSNAMTPPVNGLGTDPSDAHLREAFYAQILRLRDEVLAGKHPRLKLPKDEIAKLAALRSPPPAAAAPPVVNGRTNHASVGQASSSVAKGGKQTSIPTGPKAARKQNANNFESVLLEKSSDLIRAEIQLKRMRIERALGEAVLQRNLESKAIEPGPSFDVSEVLAKAQEAVAPVSAFAPITEGKSSSNDSFDENSYYSSQAMSWSSEESGEIFQEADTTYPGAIQDTNLMPPASVQTSQPKQAFSAASAHVPTASVPAEATVGHGLEDDAYSPPPLMAASSDTAKTYNMQVAVSLENNNEVEEEEDEDEEMDYEPPAPNALPPFHTQNVLRPAQQTLNHLDATYGAPASISPPNNNVPVHRNHIETPVAPQPARVSPLATNKVASIHRLQALQGAQNNGVASPRVEQGRRRKQNGSGGADQTSPKNSAQQSPAGPRGGVNNTRKRRRDNDNDRRRGNGKRVAKSPLQSPALPRSPEPYIKEEQVSPPPFATTPDAFRSGRRLQDQRLDGVQFVSPREQRQRLPYVEDYEPRPTYLYHQAAAEPVRVLSRPTYRVIEHPEQDMRRVASMQYARRPYSPSAPLLTMPSESRPPRSASYAYAERPAQQQPSYREGSTRPRYIRADQSLSPPPDAYVRRARSPVVMAPPPKPLIVEDEYGNRYYAHPAPPAVNVRASMAPPSWPREVDSYVERRMTREPTAVRLAPAYLEEDQPMMPPPPTRRYVELEPEALERPMYRRREYSTRPEEVRYAQEPMERRPFIRYEDMPPASQRDHLVRSVSVRPEIVPRASAVRELSGVRYGSVIPGQKYVQRPQPLDPAFEDEYGRIHERGHVPAPPQHSRMYSERRLERLEDEMGVPYGAGRAPYHHY